MLVYYITIIVLILLAGLRFQSGLDYSAYINIFKNANSIFNIFKISKIEPGFNFLAWLNNFIFKTPFTLFFFIALVSIIIKTNFIKKYTPYIFIAFFYYYSFIFHNSEMGQISNSLAIAILLLSIKYIRKRNFKKFLLIVLIATSIHYSAIVFMMAYLVNYIKLNKKTLLILFIISLIIGMFNLNSFLLNILNKLPEISPVSKAIRYLKIGKRTQRRGIGGLEILRFTIILFNIIFYKKVPFYYKNKYRLIFKLYFVGILIFFALNSNAIFSRRFARPFMFLEGLILTYNIYSLKLPISKIIILNLFSGVCFYRLYNFLQDPRWQNYKTILSKFLN